MNFNKKLNEEIKNTTPDLKNDIVNSVDWQKIKECNAPQIQAKRNFALKYALPCMACFVLLCLSIALPLGLNSPPAITDGAYALTINVNPCIRLICDESDVVQQHYGLNEDGAIFLLKENYVGMNVNQANILIMNKLERAGFALDDIGIKVTHTDGKNYDKKQNTISEEMNNYLINFGNYHLNALNDNDFDAIETYYKNHNFNESTLLLQFQNKLLIEAQIKVNQMQGLVNLLTPLIENNENIDDKINNFQYSTNIENFCSKYQFSCNLDLQSLTYKDLEEFLEELEEKIEELNEIIDEISSGDADEDDFEDLLEDLYELVEEYLYENH